jgi:hypothetical protein
MDEVSVAEAISQKGISSVSMNSSIEDDDNVMQMGQKLELMTQYQLKYNYYFIPETNTSLSFDLLYHLDMITVRKLQFHIVPSLTLAEPIKSNDWNKKITRHDFSSSILNSFAYATTNIRYIHYVPLHNFCSWLLANSNNDAINNNLITLYYGSVRISSQLLSPTTSIDDKTTLISYEPQAVQFVQTKQLVHDSNVAITMINDVEQLSQLPHPIVTDCRVLEAIIHINYNNLNKHNFVDLESLFRLYHVTNLVPFARFRGNNSKIPKFKIHKKTSETIG